MAIMDGMQRARQRTNHPAPGGVGVCGEQLVLVSARHDAKPEITATRLVRHERHTRVIAQRNERSRSLGAGVAVQRDERPAHTACHVLEALPPKNVGLGLMHHEVPAMLGVGLLQQRRGVHRMRGWIDVRGLGHRGCSAV